MTQCSYSSHEQGKEINCTFRFMVMKNLTVYECILTLSTSFYNILQPQIIQKIPIYMKQRRTSLLFLNQSFPEILFHLSCSSCLLLPCRGMENTITVEAPHGSLSESAARPPCSSCTCPSCRHYRSLHFRLRLVQKVPLPV